MLTKKTLKKLLRLLTSYPLDKVMAGEFKIYNQEVTQWTSFVVGKKYVIDYLESGDDFSNCGYVSDGVPFIATATTPTNWTNGTVVVIVNCELVSYYNDIDTNVSVTKNGNTVEIKVTNGGFIAGKTIPIIIGGSEVKVIDSNTIRFNNQNTATFYKIEVLQ